LLSDKKNYYFQGLSPSSDQKCESDRVFLRITSDRNYYWLQYSKDGESFSTLSKMDFRYLSTEVIGGFTGVVLGLFTEGNNTGHADFDWFEYR